MVKSVSFILEAGFNYLINYAALFLKIKTLSYIVSNNPMNKAPVLGCT